MRSESDIKQWEKKEKVCKMKEAAHMRLLKINAQAHQF